MRKIKYLVVAIVWIVCAVSDSRAQTELPSGIRSEYRLDLRRVAQELKPKGRIRLAVQNGSALPKGLVLTPHGLVGGIPDVDKEQEFNCAVTAEDLSNPENHKDFGYVLRIYAKGTPASCWTAPTTIVGICGGPWLRTIVGFEQAGVSAAQSNQDFFFDLYYDRPLAFNNDPDLGSKLRSWGNLRISSVPQQINTDVATFAAGFAQQVGQLKVNEVAQAFEFLGGLQYRLWASGTPDYPSSDSENDPDVHNRISANLILGGGVITPLSPKSSVQIFSGAS